MGFIRDGKHNCSPFKFKYDGRVSATITSVIKDFFEKNDHRTLIYFCFGDDGYSRHRNIVFNQWSKKLDISVQKFDNTMRYEGRVIYGSLMIMKDNPLKSLIINSFNSYLKEMESHK
jgi:hypothetical protein